MTYRWRPCTYSNGSLLKKSILAKDLDHHPWFSSHLHADNMDIEVYWECILDRHTTVYTHTRGKFGRRMMHMKR